ncbi:MAG: CRTAC1 family protein, partial [Lewinella sp.]|uniref:CRTAC1 family protein n=1 Tax=Lewinella sp. TaxID=2004506 RepID=UPI003D6B312D
MVGQSNGSNIGLYGMGVAWGDYDLDQDIDYYITNLGSNALLNNDGAGQYQDVAAAGVTNTNTPDGLLSTSWGTAFIDFDNNLYEDLFVSKGYIPAADFIATGSLDPNKLYYNNGDQTFTDISDAAGFNSNERCRGLAYGDYDNDGDVDLLVSSMYGVVDAPAVKLYRNDLDNSNNWVKIKLEGTQCNRDAIGAQISVFIDDLVLIREISGGGSHASQHSSIAHLGLADYSSIDSVQVNWPGNPTETFFDLAINEQHLLVQGASPTVRINFSVDMSFQEVNPEGVYVRVTSEDGEIRQKLLYSPYQDHQYSVSFLQELGFSGSYTLLNGRCNDGNCQEDLSEENCDDLTVDFERLLAPVLNDTTINLCFGVCYGLPCQSTVDSFSVHFAVNTAPLGQDLDDIFIRGLSPTGDDLAMSDPEGDGIYELSINLAEGFSTYFTYVNGDCDDESCAEDLSEQDCTDEINNHYRYLPPLTQDTNLTACYDVCDTDNCIVPPNFNLHFTLNTAPLDEDLDQIFIRGLSPTGADLPMNDPEGDGIYELSITLDEGYSTYYTYVNGECSDESCTEDLSGQGCTDEANNYYRFLPPLTQDTMLSACFGVCNTDSCFAPID